MRSSIVIAEDNTLIRSLLIRVIGRAAPGTRIIDVDAATDALNACQRHQPGVVLLDNGLVDMNGLAILARLKQQQHAPYVIMMTGDPNLESQARELGADQVWIKPLDITTMLSQLSGLLAA